jgi:hypothetical protein
MLDICFDAIISQKENAVSFLKKKRKKRKGGVGVVA